MHLVRAGLGRLRREKVDRDSGVIVREKCDAVRTFVTYVAAENSGPEAGDQVRVVRVEAECMQVRGHQCGISDLRARSTADVRNSWDAHPSALLPQSGDQVGIDPLSGASPSVQLQPADHRLDPAVPGRVLPEIEFRHDRPDMGFDGPGGQGERSAMAVLDRPCAIRSKTARSRSASASN